MRLLFEYLLAQALFGRRWARACPDPPWGWDERDATLRLFGEKNSPQNLLSLVQTSGTVQRKVKHGFLGETLFFPPNLTRPPDLPKARRGVAPRALPWSRRVPPRACLSGPPKMGGGRRIPKVFFFFFFCRGPPPPWASRPCPRLARNIIFSPNCPSPGPLGKLPAPPIPIFRGACPGSGLFFPRPESGDPKKNPPFGGGEVALTFSHVFGVFFHRQCQDN